MKRKIGSLAGDPLPTERAVIVVKLVAHSLAGVRVRRVLRKPIRQIVKPVVKD